MVMLGRFLVWICCFLTAAETLYGASSAENRAFNAAAHSFKATIWDRAEAEFAEFVEKFPESGRMSEAILFQAEARLERNNPTGAVELLLKHLDRSGTWKDQYLFWLGEAYFRQGDFQAASQQFTRVLQEFPGSPRRLEAGLGQATTLAQLKQWEPLITLLQATNGWFEHAATAMPTNHLVLRGYLLLGEAHLALGRPAAAESALQPVVQASIPTRSAWQREYLLTRIRLAEGKLEDALKGMTNLYTLAAETAQRNLQAESYALGAALLERAGRYEEALYTYTSNLVEGVALERQQEALLRVSALAMKPGKGQSDLAKPALLVLEKFVSQTPDSAAAPLALLSAGELRLKQYLAGQTAPPQAGTTNLLAAAMQAFGEITNRFPQHAVAGRAYLNLGWGFWLNKQMAESETCFAAASERLAEPYDQAVAILKLGDTQFQQRKLTNAVASYSRFATQFAEVQQVKTNLLERGLYQWVRAAVEAGDLPAAESAMDRLLKDFPLGFYTDDAVLTAGQSKGQRNPEGARTVFEAFLQKVPNARLAPEVRLALARTYQDQEKWTNAIAEYDRWLESYKDHPARVAAEYYRAWSEFQAGHNTNAIAGFTNLVARYNDPLYTPLAQLWVADYYYSQDNFFKAEENYKALFQSTNLPPSEMLYQARLMAGRSALGRQGWLDAINHFTNLTSNLDHYPVDLRIQAMFAYGDTLMTMDAPETNKLANLGRALEVFSKICNDYPTNEYVALAWGQKANCLLQWAQSSGDYDPATNAFHQVIQSPQADATARCIASVGLGVVYEKRADMSTNSQKTLFLRDAWHRYLDVFYASPKVLKDGEQCDPFWRKKAGWEAGRLAETLQEWSQAKSIYEQLQREFPVLGPRLERSLRKVQDQLNREAK